MTRRRLPGPYLPIDINFDGHPKIAPLSDTAFRLHVSGMLYCKRHHVDGIIAPEVLPRLVPKLKPAHVAELVDRMLWIPINGSGHYQIHDWLSWNLASAEAQDRSKQASEAARKRWRDDQ